ncbi:MULTISPECIES: EF-hand domain-containing protein [unclassified Sphingomonas]|uniref:EF-hand domain-containing protein n=1 Tax=unclassified Sphingomonas TaxID=196159 RepID=UPI000BC755CE|nr:MAG: hypothetical protein B7Z43_00660 [Sphingomonas sp. 12-62-6]OYX37399.1 MAG: hypothetical protein B7Y98_12465 [Sphingomonas sp. 32-62-10]
MLKLTLLASAMLVAAPAIAQQTPTDMQPVPPSSAAQTLGQSTTPTAPAPGDPSTVQQPPAEASTAAQPVTAPDQIAQVVKAEFPTYDKDSNGTLNTAEFGAWMVALRSASDKSVTAESKSMKTWTKSAFAQADADKSKSVTKTELTGFLSSNKG